MIRHIQLEYTKIHVLDQLDENPSRSQEQNNCKRHDEYWIVFVDVYLLRYSLLLSDGRSSSLDFFSSASHKTFWLGVCYNIPFMHSFYHHFHFMFVFNLCLNKWECFCWFRNGRLCVWVAFLLFLNFFFVFLLSSFSFLTIWFRLSPFVWFAFDFGFYTDLHATFALVYNIMKWMAFLSTM